MTPSEALRHLGAKRVIWIDDHFNRTAEQLGKMLVEKPGITHACDFPELQEAFARSRFDGDEAVADEAGFEFDVIQALTNLSQTRRDEISQIYLAAEREAEGSPVPEMTTETIRAACDMLAISDGDRWSFEGVERRVRQAVTSYCEGDDEVGYIIDLKDDRTSGIENHRGLEILKVLAGEGSRATAFVLTHETTKKKEVELERDLVQQLDASADKFPFCVISKERLTGDTVEVGRLEETFVVAIKRAGLRRSVFEALGEVDAVVERSLAEAKRRLMRIPPERLNQYVVEVGFLEGLSELHIIERALTAHMASDIRDVFGRSGRIRASNQRVRHLRDVELPSADGPDDEDLIHFRNAETWESDALINNSFSPISCGDVFEIDDDGKPRTGARRRFIVLSQACDLQIRHDGERTARTAVMVPLRYKGVDEPSPQAKVQECLVQCRLDGQTVVCNLRSATPVSLALLDLATFRDDGRVRFDSGQVQPEALLPGQRAVYRARTDWLSDYIAEMEMDAKAPQDGAGGPAAAHIPGADAGAAPETAGQADPGSGGHDETASTVPVQAETDLVKIARLGRKAQKAERKAAGKLRRSADSDEDAVREAIGRQAQVARGMQLAFMAPAEFGSIEVGGFEPARSWKESGRIYTLPARVTWRLRRVGRVRMPFASDLLDNYVSTISRNAFDVDFVGKTPERPASTAGPEPALPEAVTE